MKLYHAIGDALQALNEDSLCKPGHILISFHNNFHNRKSHQMPNCRFCPRWILELKTWVQWKASSCGQSEARFRLRIDWTRKTRKSEQFEKQKLMYYLLDGLDTCTSRTAWSISSQIDLRGLRKWPLLPASLYWWIKTKQWYNWDDGMVIGLTGIHGTRKTNNAFQW